MRRVHQYAGMLRSDNGLDNGGQIIDIRKGFDAEKDVIERCLAARGIFGSSDNYIKIRLRIWKISDYCLPTVPGFESFIAKEFGPMGYELDQPLGRQQST